METEQKAVIRLTYEELLFLTRQAGQSLLPLMSDPEQKGIDEKVTPFLLEAAQRSLLARRILMPTDNGKIMLDQAVQAILILCNQPEKMWIHITQAKEQPIQQTYSFYADGLMTSVREDLPDLFSFLLTPDVQLDWEGEALEAMAASPQITTQAYALPTAVYNQVQEQAADDAALALSILQENGVPRSEARAFLQAMADPQLTHVLQFVYNPGYRSDQDLLTIMADEASCWLVKADSVETDTVTVQAVDADTVNHEVESAFQSLALS